MTYFFLFSSLAVLKMNIIRRLAETPIGVEHSTMCWIRLSILITFGLYVYVGLTETVPGPHFQQHPIFHAVGTVILFATSAYGCWHLLLHDLCPL